MTMTTHNADEHRGGACLPWECIPPEFQVPDSVLLLAEQALPNLLERRRASHVIHADLGTIILLVADDVVTLTFHEPETPAYFFAILRGAAV